MKITIEINLDNAEFVHECRMVEKCMQKFNPVPVASILDNLRLSLLDVGVQTFTSRNIRDGNGNTVGSWELSDD